MKISRLRRTLAVFLSALMLTLCAPMSAFTAFAADPISSITFNFDVKKIPELTVGKAVPNPTQFQTSGSGTSTQIVQVITENISYQCQWVKYINGRWKLLESRDKFESGAKYGYQVACSGVFANDVVLAGNFTDKSEITYSDTDLVYFVIELGTIDEINAARVNGEYTITLNYQDGATANVNKTTSDGVIADLPEPTRTGYFFRGWYTAATGGTRVTADYVFNSNTNIYAQWYNIDENNGTVQKYISDASLTADTNDETKYVFDIPELTAEDKAEGFRYAYSIVPKLSMTSDELSNFVNSYNADLMDGKYKIFALNGFLVKDIPESKTITVDRLSTVFLFKISNNYVTDRDVPYSFACKVFAAGPAPAPTGNTIKLNANGGTLSGEATATTNASGCFETLPTAPTRDGYTFGGWYTEAIKGTKVTTSTQLADGATIYAQWYDDEVSRTKPVSFLETVQLNDVSGDDSETKFEFSDIPELSQAEIDAGFKYVYAMAPDPTAVEDAASKNQVFNDGGYNRNDLMIGVTYTNDITDNLQIELDTLSIVCFMKVNTNKTFSGKYHIFAEKDFAAGKAAASTGNTITLNANGGTNSNGDTADIDEAGKLESLPADPTYTGHAFIGWFTTVNGGTKVDTTTTLSNGDTIYAQWVDISGTIPLLNATLDPVSGNTYKFNGLTALTEDELALGYRYYYNIYTPEESDHETLESLQEAAQEEIGNTVGQSIGGVNNIFIYEDSPYVELPSSMEITIPSLSSVSIQKVNLNYHFEDDSEILYMLSFNDLVVEPAHTITLKYQDGTTADGSLTTVEGKLTSLPKPTREGYIFNGWFDAATGGNEVTTETVFDTDTTIYAQWEYTAHTWSDDYTYDTQYHWHECEHTNCPITDNSDKDGYGAHISSGEATEDNDEHCTVCGYVIKPALDHLCGRTELTFVPEVPETCTTDGTKAHYECRCGKLYSDKTAVTEVTAADLRIPAHHVWSESWTNDETQHYHLCTVCGEKNDAAAHTFADIEVITEPTEDSEGLKRVGCTVCGYEKNVTIPKLDHVHDYTTQNFDDEYHWNECRCGEISDKALHTFGDWRITKLATSTADGTKERSCSVCGYVQTGAVKYIPDDDDEDTGDIKNTTDPDENACHSDVELTKPEIIEKIELTPEELTAVENGEDINVYLEVVDNTANVSESDKDLTESVLGSNDTVAMYLDISLFKQVGENAPTKITNTNGAITIVFEMPEEFINHDSRIERTYTIVRVHDGEADKINGVFDAASRKFKFGTDKFSSYAIVYTDTTITNPNPTPNPDPTPNPNPNPNPNPTPKPNPNFNPTPNSNPTSSSHTHSYQLKYDETGHWEQCSCGKKKDIEEHTFGEWEVVQEPTNEKDGLEKHTCTICGYSETAPIISVDPSVGVTAEEDSIDMTSKKAAFFIPVIAIAALGAVAFVLRRKARK